MNLKTNVDIEIAQIQKWVDRCAESMARGLERQVADAIQTLKTQAEVLPTLPTDHVLLKEAVAVGMIDLEMGNRYQETEELRFTHSGQCVMRVALPRGTYRAVVVLLPLKMEKEEE